MIITDLIKLDEAEFRVIASRPQYNELIRKKLRFLAAAASQGCKLAGEYYLIDGEENRCLPEDVQAFMRLTKENWFEYRTKEGVCLINREQLQSSLQSLKQNEAVIVKGFRPSDYCGHVWDTADRRVFIEVYKGGFPGVLEALEMPTYYVTGKSGMVASMQENIFTKYYAFDPITGDWSLHTCADEKVALAGQQIKEICKMLRTINPEMLRMKIAWGLSRNELFIYDLYVPIGLGILE